MRISFLPDRGRKINRLMQIAMLYGAAVLLVSSPAAGYWTPRAQIDMLPGLDELSGWKRQGSPYTYLPENLYSYIDGAADQFIAYGFLKLCGAEYVCLDNRKESITVDMYDMSADLNAFGILKSKKDPSSPLLPIGREAYGSDQYIIFYSDRYYVEIQARSAGEKTKSGMLRAARVVARNIHGSSNPPWMFTFLRSSARVKGSENYIVGGILGHGFLPKGIVSDYRINGELVKAYIVKFLNREGAGAAIEQYKKYLSGAGEKVALLSGLRVHGFASKEAHHKHILVAQVGLYMVCVTELASTEQGKPLLQEIIDNIIEIIESARPYPMSTR